MLKFLLKWLVICIVVFIAWAMINNSVVHFYWWMRP
jgi:hypothetical protein